VRRARHLWCLMTNHVHLVALPAPEDSLVERDPARAGMVRRAAYYRESRSSGRPHFPAPHARPRASVEAAVLRRKLRPFMSSLCSRCTFSGRSGTLSSLAPRVDSSWAASMPAPFLHRHTLRCQPGSAIPWDPSGDRRVPRTVLATAPARNRLREMMSSISTPWATTLSWGDDHADIEGKLIFPVWDSVTNHKKADPRMKAD